MRLPILATTISSNAHGISRLLLASFELSAKLACANDVVAERESARAQT
jgi:hypothetical protein